MTIYHGSTDIVRTPRIIRAYTGRDFGAGFYTTEILDQAVKWAARQARYRNRTDAFLNIYDLDDSALRKLNILDFKDYSMEWLDFVVACRHDADYRHNYDLVTGKIANDDVGETIQAVVDGLTSKEFALSKLVFMHANCQTCFSTENALQYLTFKSAERVN